MKYFQVYGQKPGPLPASEPLYKNLEIIKFKDIFKLNIATFVFAALINKDCPTIFHDWFQYDHEIHDHATRAGTEVIRENYFDIGHVEPTRTLHIKGSKNGYGAKMLKVYGPTLWNSLPEDIQNAPGICTFKDNLKKDMLAQYNENLVND